MRISITKLKVKIEEICSKNSGEIVLFDAEEQMDWGIPTLTETGIRITAKLSNTIDGEKSHFYPWRDISLFCHDGFQLKMIKDKMTKFEQTKIYKIILGRNSLDCWDWDEVTTITLLIKAE